MTTTAIAPRNGQTQPAPEILERVIATGDLEQLTPTERVQYYQAVCSSIGLNPLTQPFQYLKLNGKLTLYATRAATDQIRAIQNVSVTLERVERIEDIYLVVVRATLPSGRTDASTGAVSIGGLKGEALANALMKAETKAKRRCTLSACGLGWLDESEVGSIPNAPLVQVDPATGEIVQPAQPAPTIRMVDPVTAEVGMPAPTLDYKQTLTWLQKLPTAETRRPAQREAVARLCEEKLPAEAQRYGLELPERTADMDPAAWATRAVMSLAERDDSRPF